MKGDFSFIGPDAGRYSGVRHQQGRVLLDRDWNDAQEIGAQWQQRLAGDTLGPGVLAVPAASATAFQVLSASADAAGVHVALAPGRAWASGVAVQLPAAATLDASYLGPPLVPAVDPGSIAAGVRDAVLLEVFEDTVSGFQDPSAALVEPALGGPDTTERVQAFATLRLLRLGENEDCSAVAALVDDPAARGRLSVTPSPSIVITGDCPLEAGGGYTGLEHFLYRIEVASPSAAGAARFKWSQFNGGLVGRGIYAAGAPGTGTISITANDQAINTCGVDRFYLEALQFDAALGAWVVTFTADADRSTDGVLALGNVSGAWPAPASGTGFFRLWNGVADIAPFATGAPVAFVDGLELQFDLPTAGNANYRPGDYWTWPVRASGVAFDPPVWPLHAPPAGIVLRRAALAEITWQASGTGFAARWDEGQIEDCRQVFRPLTRQKICCSYIVGDGKTSFGDFDSIELALRHLPAAGGEICLLPGLHTTNTVIRDRMNVTIRGCGARTRVLPREAALDQPIFSIVDSTRIEIDHIDFVTLGGSAIWIEGRDAGTCDDIVIAHHRILACTHAVYARNASHLAIAHNRIRMFDRAEGEAAIDVAGEDVLVERNDIALVPAERTPPVDPDHPEDPIDPVDPCARLGLVYLRPLVFTKFVNHLWTLQFPIALLLKLARPYLGRGGIQLRGGCERVRVLENRVAGGAGHGITLGALPPAAPPAPPPPTFVVRTVDCHVRGRVIGPDGKPAPGVQVTLTRKEDGSQRTALSSSPDGDFDVVLSRGEYAVTEGAVGLEIDKVDTRFLEQGTLLVLVVVLKESAPPPAAETGFLYDIAIERNDVTAMGLCGIGVPLEQAELAGTTLDRARALLGWPVIGLQIRDNRLQDNLRNPFDRELRARSQTRGLGGISLGLVDRLQVTGNRIEGNGRSGADPACGIFVQYGESVEVAGNVIVDNGPAPAEGAAVQPGQRGGLVFGLAASFGLFARLRRGDEDGATSSALRMLGNHVEQPVGCALRARVFGEAIVNDNVLASQRAGVGGLDALAGTVLLSNLAGVQNAGLPVQVSGATTAPAGTAATDANVLQPVGNLTHFTPGVLAAVALPPPSGALMFNDNQTRAGPAHRAAVTQLLVGYDDIGFSDNQCRTEQPARLYANTIVMAASLRACGNRLRETRAETNLSLLTISRRANNTSFNQGDHCIVAQDTDPAPPATVQSGNQVLQAGARCASFNTLTALLFKPLES